MARSELANSASPLSFKFVTQHKPLERVTKFWSMEITGWCGFFERRAYRFFFLPAFALAAAAFLGFGLLFGFALGLAFTLTLTGFWGTAFTGTGLPLPAAFPFGSSTFFLPASLADGTAAALPRVAMFIPTRAAWAARKAAIRSFRRGVAGSSAFGFFLL